MYDRWAIPRPHLGVDQRIYGGYRVGIGRVLAVTGTIAELIIGLSLIVFAGLRYRNLSQVNKEAGLRSHELVDQSRIESSAVSDVDGVNLIYLRTGAATLLPAVLQTVAGLVGLWPLWCKTSSFLQVSHVSLCSLVIYLWIDAICSAGIELNLVFVQLSPHNSNNSVYPLLITVLSLVAIAVLFLNSATLIYSLVHHVEGESHGSPPALLLSMVIFVTAAVSLGISIYQLTHSLSPVSQWHNSGLNSAALYGFGVKEAVISSFILIQQVFNSLVLLTNSRALRISVAILQGVSFVSILGHLLNPDRLAAIPVNLHLLSTLTTQDGDPVTFIGLLLSFLISILLAFLLLLHLIAVMDNVFEKRTPRLFSIGQRTMF